MTWPSGPAGRLLAGLYLLAFCFLLSGLSWTIYNQTPPAIGMFAGSGAVMWLLALGLRNRVPEAGRGGLRFTGYQRAWYRLALGLELGAAVRLAAVGGAAAKAVRDQ